MSDGANIMFEAARNRCFLQKKPDKTPAGNSGESFDDDWDVLDEIEGRAPSNRRQEAEGWMPWMPSGMQPVLEELPKWKILLDTLSEIEETLTSHPAPFCESMKTVSRKMVAESIWAVAPGSNVTLIMAADQQTCTLIKDLLSSPRSDSQAPGRELLENRLRLYLYWKRRLVDSNELGRGSQTSKTTLQTTSSEISEALRKKDAGRAFTSKNRRRVRGGAPGESSSRSAQKSADSSGFGADTLAEMLVFIYIASMVSLIS